MTRIDLDELSREAGAYFRGLQGTICETLEKFEEGGPDNGRHFREDAWQHPGGGGGITRILLNGRVVEKAGVNFSQVNAFRRFGCRHAGKRYRLLRDRNFPSSSPTQSQCSCGTREFPPDQQR